MAIAKMKKLHLIVLREKKEELLKRLISLGCLHVSEIEDSEETGLTRESTELISLKEQYDSINHVISVLNKFVPQKTPLLSAKPEVEPDVLLDASGLSHMLDVVSEIRQTEDTIKQISNEEIRLKNLAESLAPWDSLDFDLSITETKQCRTLLGTVPATVDLAAMNSDIREVSEEFECFRIFTDKNQHYLFVICMKENADNVLSKLHEFGFAATAFNNLKGTARENISSCGNEITRLNEENKAQLEKLKALSANRDELKLSLDRVSAKISMAEADDKLLGTKNAVVLQGWYPEKSEKALSELFDEFNCAWEGMVPTENEYPEVPVKLDNNAFTESLNMVTDMYSLPAYGTVDPNPLMAPFFIVIFGLMFADIGYGLLMIIAAAIAFKKIKPRGGTLTFCRLLLYCGISTTICGGLTGGLFGDAPLQISKIINPETTWQGLPALFNPLTDSIVVLIGAMILGLIHLIVGMAVNVVMKVKAGNIMGAIFEEGSIWVIFIGAGLWFLGILNIGGIPVVLIIGILMMFWGSMRNAEGLGKLTAPIGAVYNEATGWFGDILSYSRIMALMLAGSVIGQVFNTLAFMPLKSGVNVLTVIVALIIFLIGHTLNFGLNLLGCFVHDLRLQCLEFFKKFYQDGGKPFRPLGFKTNYVNIKE